ncbi:hypothetical protein AVEN_122771-1 [Araneus ventricosus]|uniref:Uncharacterized protein n=1 Tax=Araneus ventricosus TaxID=182803 RepID=A0A4Y2WXC5_ARAVE|nr:hypothetical protein AVEN_122771-1 [Araneus ventricosus]
MQVSCKECITNLLAKHRLSMLSIKFISYKIESRPDTGLGVELAYISAQTIALKLVLPATPAQAVGRCIYHLLVQIVYCAAASGPGIAVIKSLFISLGDKFPLRGQLTTGEILPDHGFHHSVLCLSEYL